ncbi:YihY/virulence factor BrkB family protein [Clostridium sp. Marseille-P3244]|uniref:YihY/virulence factor BrkB family protein n=1 Tax=Clostridium sp. Marseille-P3244 TaxID=1871020 RepID=UPI0009317339|nr:YihY/virulence factor BrkB family protein [Clostridium sp. Marseille-P3244]
MEKRKQIKYKIIRIILMINSHHTGAYAAQAAYFFVLSLIPIFLLLLTMVQFTPVTMDDVLKAVLQVFPDTVQPLMRSIVIQVYTQSSGFIPVTVLVALWSAGRGVLSVTSGLNCIYSNIETRNYIYLRVRASFYTVIFLLAIMLSLVLSVFGNSISVVLYEHVPFLSRVVDFIIRIRTLVTLIVLTVFWDLVYKFLPNRKNRAKTTLRKQLPGAVFTACGWLLISFIFSIYLDVFTGFSSMYGSLTTIILIMLWLYGCMYIILLGGELNAILEKFLGNKPDPPVEGD